VGQEGAMLGRRAAEREHKERGVEGAEGVGATRRGTVRWGETVGGGRGDGMVEGQDGIGGVGKVVAGVEGASDGGAEREVEM
jgi:hypothetical protein